MEQKPATLPIGLRLSSTGRRLQRAFDAALGDVGGSLPVWLVLLNVKIRGVVKQRDLAAAVGVTEATLTHHLTALERNGIVRRRREESNRRVQLVQLTEAGEERFLALRAAAVAFDARLRQGIEPDELITLEGLLDRIAANVAEAKSDVAPWIGLIE